MQKIRKNLTVNFSKKLENLILDQFWSENLKKRFFPKKHLGQLYDFILL